MTDAPTRPCGDSEDLLVAYQHGAASMKDRIRELEAERDKLRETITEWEILAANLQDVLKKAPEQ